MNKNKWYHDGVTFECTGCGRCCEDHGEYTFVYLVKPDIEAVGKYLGLSTSDLLEKYCIQKDGLTFLRMESGQCPFLENGGCIVYSVRPVQCRSWPFWQDNLDKETWDRDVLPFCPGIGKGKLYTKEEIERIAAEAEEGFDSY